jgi:hypothetical protein
MHYRLPDLSIQPVQCLIAATIRGQRCEVHPSNDTEPSNIPYSWKNFRLKSSALTASHGSSSTEAMTFGADMEPTLISRFCELITDLLRAHGRDIGH